MKSLRSLLLLLLVCSFSGLAKADPVDFQFQVLDPGSQTLNDLDGTPFQVTFEACPPGYSAQGCFFGLNVSGSTFTSLTLTFNNTMGTAGDFVHFLNGQTPTCNTGSNDGSSGAFSSANCSLSSDMSTYTLNYFGPPGVGNHGVLILEEIGPDPSAFGTGNGTVTLSSVTPEPGSIVTLSTGLMALGMLVMKRRRGASESSRQS